MNVIPFPAPATAPAPAPLAPPCRPALFGLPDLWMARHRYRSMLRNELLLQPASVLEDAGMSRHAAEREAAKPVWRA